MQKSVEDNYIYSLIYKEKKKSEMLKIKDEEIATTNKYICNVRIFNNEMDTFKDVKALIDTGATFTGVNPSVVKQLRLNPYSFFTYATPDEQKIQKSKYDFKLKFDNIDTIVEVTGSEMPYETEKFDAVIGVDVLRLGTLIIDKGNLTFNIK